MPDVKIHILTFVVLERSNRLPVAIEKGYVCQVNFFSAQLALEVLFVAFNIRPNLIL